jgi:hypothetical protein
MALLTRLLLFSLFYGKLGATYAEKQHMFVNCRHALARGSTGGQQSHILFLKSATSQEAA